MNQQNILPIISKRRASIGVGCLMAWTVLACVALLLIESDHPMEAHRWYEPLGAGARLEFPGPPQAIRMLDDAEELSSQYGVALGFKQQRFAFCYRVRDFTLTPLDFKQPFNAVDSILEDFTKKHRLMPISKPAYELTSNGIHTGVATYRSPAGFTVCAKAVSAGRMVYLLVTHSRFGSLASDYVKRYFHSFEILDEEILESAKWQIKHYENRKQWESLINLSKAKLARFTQTGLPKPRHYWDLDFILDEEFYDSGTNRSEFLFLDQVAPIEGVMGQGLRLACGHDYPQLYLVTDDLASPWSIAFWFRPSVEAVEVLRTPVNRIVWRDGQIEFARWGSDGLPRIVHASTINEPGAWLHLAVTSDDRDQISYYLNGQLVATALSDNEPFKIEALQFGIDVCISDDQEPNTSWFELDEILMFSECISAWQIRKVQKFTADPP